MERKRIYNQTGVIFATCLLMFLSSQIAAAANYAVRSPNDCPYNGDGTSWACAESTGGIGAMNDIPHHLTHGNTYYIAAGAYAGESIGDEAYTGTTWAYVKKATSAAHGINEGWIDSYAAGQATFPYLYIQGPYVEVDGVSGSRNTGHGIKIERPASALLTNGDVVSLWIIMEHAPYGVSNVVVKNVEISMTPGGCADMDKAGAAGYTPNTYTVKATRGNATNVKIQNCYIHGGSTNVQIGSWNHSEISGNYFGENCSRSWAHGQQISPVSTSYIYLYNNEFYKSETFVIGAHQGAFPATVASGNSNWYVYNNIVVGGALTAGFAMAESGEADGLTSSQFHNNTFVNVALGRGAVFVGTQTDVAKTKSYAYNNLFYNCANPRMDNADKTVGAIVHDNNAYLACSGTINSSDESAPQVGSDDPFVDSASGKYQLRAGALPVNKGKALIAAYSKDYNGVTRPQGGAWDIGAYEYVEAQSTLFVTSVNGTVTSNPSGINCGSTCYANFDADAWVTLTALPNSGYTFTGWSGGGCSGNGTCTVSMASAQVVTANYTAAVAAPSASTTIYFLSVSKTIVGAGTITANDNTINCGSTCKANYNAGKTVSLSVSVNSGYKFSRWTGACKGQGATCTVSMTASQNTKAYFAESK